jgi:hypothetical protein
MERKARYQVSEVSCSEPREQVRGWANRAAYTIYLSNLAHENRLYTANNLVPTLYFLLSQNRK